MWNPQNTKVWIICFGEKEFDENRIINRRIVSKNRRINDEKNERIGKT